ncbi:MAG: hypothetical protein QM677_10150 [Microbacterium sp.]
MSVVLRLSDAAAGMPVVFDGRAPTAQLLAQADRAMGHRSLDPFQVSAVAAPKLAWIRRLVLRRG